MRRLLSFAALTCLAACTVADDSYPSLLPRPIESRSDAEPLRPDIVAAPDPALDARIAEQRAAGEAASRRFNVAAVEAETRVAVARGLAVGSEPWIRAQTALADLDPIRGELAGIVAGLEEIAIARASAGEPAYPALDAAIAELGAISEAQGNRLAALEDAIAG
jgi:hypothetical protein